MSKITKSDFNGGSVILHCPGNASLNEFNEMEISGKVELKLRQNVFVRGVWIKLVGKNVILNPVNNKELFSYNLLQYEEYFHIDGIHEVFIGFAEGDDDNGSLLELGAGKHRWPFVFKLPKYTPPSYCDDNVSVSYVVSAIMDSPVIPMVASTASQVILVESIPDADCRLMLENGCTNVITPNKVTICKPSHTESNMIGRLLNLVR